MGTRRQSRELVLQVLYCADMGKASIEEVLEFICADEDSIKGNDEFVKRIVDGISQHKKEIDETILQFSKNWKLHRMSCIDRNILRISIFEMQYCPDIPNKVSINEAIDIGKKYGTEDSGSFINGILDQARIKIERSV